MQISIQVASTGQRSSLEGSPITSSGSTSVFEALPPAALAILAASDPNGTAGVVTLFTTTTFDPYIDAPAGSGITRLAFSSPVDGSPIEVSNLSTPILFSLPSMGGDGDRVGVCSFWDTAGGAYRRARARAIPTACGCPCSLPLSILCLLSAKRLPAKAQG